MPLHTAAINPNTKALAEIYDAHPDVHVVDGDGNKPIHFAATCDSIEPLKFLLSKGAVIDDTTKVWLRFLI